jgi:hypothetical protein
MEGIVQKNGSIAFRRKKRVTFPYLRVYVCVYVYVCVCVYESMYVCI